MRKVSLLACVLIGVLPLLGITPALAEGTVTTMNFAVTRNGEPIGNTTIRLQRKGDQTIAEVATQVRVKIAFITVYSYEQRQIEHWGGGKLLSMTSVTDDNGTVHKVSAARVGEKLSVNADGAVREVDPAMIPANLWNPSLMRSKTAIDPKDGTVMPVLVVDRGKERLVLQGQPTVAHRYSIKTTIPQEVWYDEHNRLLRVELRGSDGSTIHTTRSAT